MLLTQGQKLNIKVHSLYKLAVCLPLPFDVEDAKSFFDCKTRMLGIVLPVSGMHIKQELETEEEIAEPVETKFEPVELQSEDMLMDVV